MRSNNFFFGLIFGGAALSGLSSCAMAQTYYVPYQPPYRSYPQYAAPAPPVVPAVAEPAITLTADQLDQLVAPIALYPDPLLAQIFPAATYPQDVAAAEQWLQTTSYPTEDAIQAQTWDASIKALTHYPTVLQMMANDLDWTQTLGAAFLNQQQDVMDAVQRFRVRAQAAGNLQSNQQEQIVNDDNAIRIEPVDPNVVCIPQYDPNLVCVQQCPIDFGIGLPIGLWLDNDFDWHHHRIDHGGGWYQGWHHPEEWDRNPPKWDVHPPHFVAPAPKPWVRNPAVAAPRLLPEVANRALAHSQGDHRPIPPGRQPPPVPVRPPPPVPAAEPRNAFEPNQSREDVQRAQERARAVNPPPPPKEPARAAPAAPPREVPPAPAPREVPRAAPPAAAPPPPPREAPREAPPAAPPPREAPPPPRAAPAPPPPREAPSGFPSGGNANDTRAQSARGNASSHH